MFCGAAASASPQRHGQKKPAAYWPVEPSHSCIGFANAPAQNAPPNYLQQHLRGVPFPVVNGSSQSSVYPIGRLYRASL